MRRSRLEGRWRWGSSRGRLLIGLLLKPIAGHSPLLVSRCGNRVRAAPGWCWQHLRWFARIAAPRLVASGPRCGRSAALLRGASPRPDPMRPRSAGALIQVGPCTKAVHALRSTSGLTLSRFCPGPAVSAVKPWLSLSTGRFSTANLAVKRPRQ